MTETSSPTTFAVVRKKTTSPLLFLLNRLPLLFFLIALNLFSNPVNAQVSCPLIVLSGDGQSGSSGDTTAPLEVKQYANFVSVPSPTAVTFTYTITSGDASFVPTGGASYTSTVPFVIDNFPTYLAALLRSTTPSPAPQLVLGPTSGTVQVSVQSSVCAGLAAPQIFNINNSGALPALGSINALSRDGETVSSGQSINLAVSLTPGSGGGSGTGVPVTFSVDDGLGVFFTTGRNVATISSQSPIPIAGATFIPSVASGPVSILVEAPGYVPTTLTIQVLAQKSIRIVSGNGQEGLVDALGQPLVVSVTLADGTPVAGDAIQWRTPSGQGLRLNRAVTSTDSSGRSQNAFQFGSTPGASSVTASLENGPSITFSIRTIAQQEGTLRLVSGGQQSGVISSAAVEPLVFELKDNSGSPMANQRVDFSVTEGSAVLNDAFAQTDTLGRASVHFRYSSQPGVTVIQASALNNRAQATASVTGYTLSLMIVSGNNQTGLVNTRLAQPLVIKLTNPSGLSAGSLGNITVNWSVVSGGGTLASANSLTDTQGQSNNTLQLGASAGVSTIRATIAGAGSVDFTATANNPPPALTDATFEIISGNNQTLIPGTVSAPLIVRVRNSSGSALSGIPVQWNLTPGSLGSLTSNVTLTDSSGQASNAINITMPGFVRVTASIGTSNAPTALVFSINGGLANMDQLTPRQRSMANVMDNACSALQQLTSPTQAQQQLLDSCNAMNRNASLRPTEVRMAMHAMFSDQSGSQNRVAMATTTAQLDNLKSRFTALRNGAQGIQLNGLTLATNTGSLPLSFLPSTLLSADSDISSSDASDSFSRWGFFATGTLSQGDSQRSIANDGFSFDTYGLTAGVDYRYSDHFVLGTALGYNNNTTDINGNRGEMKAKGTSLSLYASYYWGQSFYTDATLSYGQNSYEISRRIRYQITQSADDNVDQLARAKPDGSQTAFTLSMGRDFNFNAWNVSPYVRATYTDIQFDGYREVMSLPNARGAGLALAFDERSLSSLEGVIGGRVSYTMSTNWGVLTPHAQFEWLHEFENTQDDATSRFINDPTGTLILMPEQNTDSDYANLGLGLSGVFNHGRSAFVHYERRAGQSNLSQDSLALGFRIEF